ncbi:response regulator [Luteimonas saliphila]|uniref:response regulator n=1 Tax=Luteimonas saliphila TaxID=2804919 RepID=UPI001EE240ED|nr:response regulator [Luteimonas saliphila]
MNPRILLVEDDPTSRAFLQAATEGLPAVVDLAGSVAEARVLATRHAHALWLIDAHLPDGSGSELLQDLRERGLTTPAIAHTASRDRTEHAALLAAGFASTLAKPLPAGAWTDALRLALDDGSTAQVAADVETPVEARDTPVWDEAQALAALAGDAGNVAALRALFIAELPATRDTVASAAGLGDDDALRGALHRLRAGCGFVGAARLDVAATRLRDAPASNTALQDFLAAVQDTLSSP